MTNSANLHCLLRQGISCSAREGLTVSKNDNADVLLHLIRVYTVCFGLSVPVLRVNVV